MGEGLTVLLVLVSLIACSESSKSPSANEDELVEAYASYPGSRGLTSTSGSYASVNELLWYYTAEKKDKLFSTGAASDETLLNTDDYGNALLGLPEDAFGEFSIGSWLFMFYAYEVTETESSDDAVYTVTTDDSTTYYALGDLYYSSENYSDEDYYTTLKSSSNTVSVYVDQVDGCGNLLLTEVYLADENGNKLYFLESEPDDTDDTDYSYYVIINDETTYAVVTLTDSSGSTVREVTDSSLAVTTSGGLYISYTTESESEDGEELSDSSDTYLIPKGYYTPTVTFYHDIDGDEESDMLGTASAENVRIVPSKTTTVTGDTLEVTVDAELDDINITYYTVSVSSEEELINALALDGATVVLTASIEVTSTITISNETVLDLNGYTISNSTASIVFVLEEGADVTVTDGSDDGDGEITSTIKGYVFEITDNDVSLTVEGGTISATKASSRLIYISADAAADDGESKATVTISGGTLDATAANIMGIYDNGGAVILVEDGTVSTYSYTIYTCKDTDSEITVTGGTLTSTKQSIVYLISDGAEVSLEGGNYKSLNYIICFNSTSSNSSAEIVGGTYTVAKNSDSTSTSYAVTMAGTNNSLKVTSDASITVTNSGTAEVGVFNIDGTSNKLVVEGGTYEADYGIQVSKSSSAAVVEISGGTFDCDVWSIYVSGEVKGDDAAKITITDGTFKGEVYIGGSTSLTISGGSFTGYSTQALHVKAGSVAITGGTFTSGLSSKTGYTYASYSNGSSILNGSIAIEAAEGYGGIGSVSVSSVTVGEGAADGVYYYIDPNYSSTLSDPVLPDGAVTVDPSTLVYRKSCTITGTVYAYFTDKTTAESCTTYYEYDGTGYTLGTLQTGSYSSWSDVASE